MNIEQSEIELIINYLEGNISPQQSDAFFVWLEKDKNNEKYFFEIKSIYQSKKINLDQDFDVIESWLKMKSKLEKKLEQEEGIVRQKESFPIKINKRFFLYAASIAAIVISSVLFFATNSSNHSLIAHHINNETGVSSIQLPDGTIVKLGAHTEFHYLENYGSDTRTIFLDGEAYFEVTKNESKPFIVQAGEQKVEVLGTKFNVQAYSSDSMFIATLFEGSVAVNTQNDKTFILVPGEQLAYNKLTTKTEIGKTNTDNTIAWLTGYYRFEDEPLAQILNRMEKIYGVKFDLKSVDISQLKFSGTFYEGQSFDDFMNIIKIGTNLVYKREGNSIEILRNKS